MSAYGNRGMTFESLIEYANRRYRLDGKAIIEKQHTLCKPLRDRSGKIYSAKYEEKATVDFMGRFGARPIAFEAKQCQDQKIDLKRVEEHQCDFLRDWTSISANGKAIAFVIISFELSRFFLIPYRYWDEHEFLLSIVECYTHIINYSFAKVVQIERKTKYFWIFLRCISKPCKTE